MTLTTPAMKERIRREKAADPMKQMKWDAEIEVSPGPPSALVMFPAGSLLHVPTPPRPPNYRQ